MIDKSLKEGTFYQADNGEWFALTKTGVSGGMAVEPALEHLEAADITALSPTDRTGRFSCMDGIYEVGGAGSSDRTGRFSCMDGVYEVGGAGSSDRTGRFSCMDGVYEVGGAGSPDRSGRFGCMDGICEV